MKIPDYEYGFDWLRALLPFFVIAIHTNAVSSFGNLFLVETKLPNIFDVIQFNLLFLAVPSFLLMSLFLLFKKQRSSQNDLFKIYKLLILYVFWVGLWLLFTKKVPSWDFFGVSVFIIRGGNSIFYFLFTLVFLTSVASLIRKFSHNATWFFLLLSLLLINISFPIINMLEPRYKNLVAYWNPLLFLSIVFAAKLMVHYESNIRLNKKFILIIFVVYFFISIIEWTTLMHPNHKLILATEFPSYARVSPLIGAVLLLSISFFIKCKPATPVIILSSLSLGLYCVHPFLLVKLGFLKSAYGSSVFFVTVSLVSILLTIGLKRILTERLI